MWVTIVREVFRDQDRVAVRDAIEEIASPLDGYGWSSAGIYAFWDPETHRDPLLGLATDLPYRFGQHTGLVKCRPTSCKIVQIDGSRSVRKLGYTLPLQT